MNIFILILVISIYSFAFFLKGSTYLDPDFGWHMRMGQYILQYGIPQTDPLSFTMPSYPIIDLEWLSHMGLFQLYETAGMAGLNIICACITFLAIVIHIPRKDTKWAYVPLLLSTTLLFFFFSVRTQVLSWLFFSLLIVLFFNESHWKKWRFSLPFLMLLWANMHGSFMLGLITVIFFAAVRSIQRKATRLDVMLFLASCGAAFLTPYGYRLFEETWIQSTDENLHWRYGEWMPLAFHFDLLMIGYIAIVSCLLFVYRKAFPRHQLLFAGIILFGGLSHLRHVPFFLILAIPLMTTAIKHFAKDMKLKKTKHTQTIYASLLAFLGILSIWYMTHNFTIAKDITEDQAYPKGAVAYLKNNMPEKQILSVFEWGGYLDWKLPEKKVYLDGRMPNWRLTHPGPHESASIYREDEQLQLGYISLAETVKKYDIDTIVYYAPSPKPWKHSESTLIFSQYIKRPKPPYPPLEEQFHKDGWKLVFKDSVSSVYKKK